MHWYTGDGPPARWIVNFDRDFVDGLVLAAVLAAYCPYLVWLILCGALSLYETQWVFVAHVWLFLQDLEPLQQDVYQNLQSRADPSQQHHRVSGLKCTRSQPGCIGKYWIRPQRCLPLWKTRLAMATTFFCSPKSSSHYHRIMACYLVMTR